VKLKYIIGVLALLLLMIGTASAETFYLTNTSENVDGISIKVTCNGTHIIITDESTVVNAEKADIKGIRLYLQNEYVKSVADPDHSDNVWTHTSDYKSNFAGFGEFFTLCDKSTDKTKSRGPIVIELNQSLAQLPENALKNSIVVHLGFGTDILDVSGKNQDSSWVTGGTHIPEFPTIALPVAAILGIMFIFGRRKQK